MWVPLRVHRVHMLEPEWWTAHARGPRGPRHLLTSLPALPHLLLSPLPGTQQARKPKRAPSESPAAASRPSQGCVCLGPTARGRPSVRPPRSERPGRPGTAASATLTGPALACPAARGPPGSPGDAPPGAGCLGSRGGAAGSGEVPSLALLEPPEWSAFFFCRPAFTLWLW